MFYRIRRNINYFKFYHQTKRLLDTPPLKYQNGPVTIVTMVAGYDVHLYVLAMKSLYRRLGSGKIIAIIAQDVTKSNQEFILQHLGPVEFVHNESIQTGEIQHSGTWERLVYLLGRTQSEYVIQADCDILLTGPIPEVLDSIANNRAFTLADGLPKKPLVDYVEDGKRRNLNNIVFDFEIRAREFPDAGNFQYLRGSSGFAGFARGGATLEQLLDFHRGGEKVFGARWREWGTEQIASNFIIANSLGSIGLPKPKYLTWERHTISQPPSLLHFLGYCRFDQGVYANYANREIDAMLEGR